ncbi:MAG: amino acid/polyamine/organocation transporter, superfamily, partial [Acidimicrobiales bacterium]|nr:amino acid/polyamine/organocation transporter, superfamily [Acidimicrobiales bacterium]
NTAYADFPRLSSIIAKDGFLPRQMANRGDRLVFSNGVVFLGVAAGVLLVAFGGVTNALIPLYAVGVFTSFTLSQAAMVQRHRKLRQPGWRRGVVISGAGSVATLIVLLIVAVTKFAVGAWVPIIVVPVIIALFAGMRRHYDRVGAALAITPEQVTAEPINHTVVVLVGRIHRGVLKALAYGKSLRPQYLVAAYVSFDEEDQEAIEKDWKDFRIDVPLEIIASPYRELVAPIERYIDELDDRYDNDTITVIIPEFVVDRWFEHALHNQSALILKGRLLFRENTVVISVPYHLRRNGEPPPGGPPTP